MPTDSIQAAVPNAADPGAPANDNAPAAAAAQPPRPRPILPDAGEPTPFPTDGMGPILGAAAKAIAEIVQAPAAIAGTSALAAATLAVQAHGDVELPHGQVRPLSNFFISVAQSGDRKSAVDGLATRALKTFMRELMAKYDEAMETYEVDLAAALAAKQEPPKLPVLPTLLMDDPTPEGIFRALSEGWPSAGIFTDEGGRFLGGHSMTPEQRLRTATTLSKLWDGGELSRVRGGEPAAMLADRRVSGHLMVQPEVAKGLLSDASMRDQGLLSRMLVTAPASLMGTRFFRKPTPEALAVAGEFSDHLLALLREPLPTAARPRGALRCRAVPFSAPAEGVWIMFHDEIERQLVRDGRLRPITGLAAKLAEHAGRIAGVLALVEDLAAPEIALAHIEGAVALARHYAEEALRLSVAAGAANPDLVQAAKLGAWLLKRHAGELVSLADVEQGATPTALRNAGTARRMMAVLEEHGWIVRRPGAHIVRGKPRQEVWSVVPQDGSWA